MNSNAIKFSLQFLIDFTLHADFESLSYIIKDQNVLGTV